MSDVNTIQSTPVQEQKTQQNTAATVFNPAVVKKAYSPKEWDLKEQFYINQISTMTFNISPGPSEIKDMALKIDGLLSIARIDAAYAKQAYERYNNILKIEEKKSYNDVKLQLSQSGSKATVGEIESAIAQMIDSNPWANTSESLYSIVRMTNERNIFMEGIVNDLKDKKDLLITHSGIIKIEYSLSNMEDNAPKV